MEGGVARYCGQDLLMRRENIVFIWWISTIPESYFTAVIIKSGNRQFAIITTTERARADTSGTYWIKS